MCGTPIFPLHIWSQFDALSSDDTCLQSILLEECKSTDLERFKSVRNGSTGSTGSSTDKKEELIWTTIGRFGLEEELQRVRWIGGLFEEEVSNNLYLCRSPFCTLFLIFELNYPFNTRSLFPREDTSRNS